MYTCRADCRVDDGAPVVVNSTAIGAALGAMIVAAGAYLSNLLFNLIVITTGFALYIPVCFEMPLSYLRGLNIL